MSYSHECGVQGQIFFAPPAGALGRGQKVKYHLIPITKSISKIFIPNFVCVHTNKRKYIEQNFHSVVGVMPKGWDLGAGGSKTLAWGFAMVPHPLRILVWFVL